VVISIKKLSVFLILGLISSYLHAGVRTDSIKKEKDIKESEIGYWSLWTDEEGVSHQSLCKLDSLSLQNFSVSGAPEWVSNDDMKTSRYVFNIMPVGWTGDWHKSPKPQWVIPTEGNWYIESMDNHRVEFGPGELSFGYDGISKLKDGKIGHLSGNPGDEPARVLVIQVDSLPKNISDKRCMAGGSFIR